MKIVALDTYAADPGDMNWERIEKLGQLTRYDRTEPEKVVERIGDAEIVLTNKVIMTEEIMEKCPSIKYIGVLATGYNTIDVKAASKHGVTVCNIPAYSTEAVAQHTFALILEAAAHVGEHSRACLDGQWERSPDFTFWNYPLFELAGKTLGIIGYGTIGQQVGKIAEAFKMNVITYRRKDGKAGLENLLKNSDIVSLHCPLNDESNELINKDTISLMKDGAILINTARGGCVNERDAADALNCGKLAYLCADSVSSEPIKPSNPLLKAKNVILTPHIAWAPKETRSRLFDIAANNIEMYIKGTPVNVVS